MGPLKESCYLAESARVDRTVRPLSLTGIATARSRTDGSGVILVPASAPLMAHLFLWLGITLLVLARAQERPTSARAVAAEVAAAFPSASGATAPFVIPEANATLLRKADAILSSLVLGEQNKVLTRLLLQRSMCNRAESATMSTVGLGSGLLASQTALAIDVVNKISGQLRVGKGSACAQRVGRAESFCTNQTGRICSQQVWTAQTYWTSIHETLRQAHWLLQTSLRAAPKDELERLAPFFLSEQHARRWSDYTFSPWTKEVESPESVFALPAVVYAMLALSAAIMAAFVIQFFARETRVLLTALSCLVVLSASFEAAAFAIRAHGYTLTGEGGVSRLSLFIVHRLGTIGLLALLALFSIVLVEALMESMINSESRVPRVMFFAVGCLSALYAIIMAVVATVPMQTFVLDSSDLVLSLTLTIFALSLAIAFASALAVVAQTRKDDLHFRELIGMSGWLAGWATLLFVICLARCVVTGLWLFHSEKYYEKSLYALEGVSGAVLCAGVLVYVGIALRGRSKMTGKNGRSDGYQKLGSDPNDAVPAVYDV